MSEEQRGSAQTRDGAVPLGENCGQIGRPPVRGGDLAAALAGAAAGQTLPGPRGNRDSRSGRARPRADERQRSRHGRGARSPVRRPVRRDPPGTRRRPVGIRRELLVSAVGGLCSPPLPRAPVRRARCSGRAGVARCAVDPLLVVRPELYPGAGEGRGRRGGRVLDVHGLAAVQSTRSRTAWCVSGECPHEYPCSEDAVIGPPTVTRIAAVLPQPSGMMPTRCFRAVRRGERRAVDILPRYRKSARPRASFGSPRSGEGSGSRPKMTLSPPEWLHSKWTRRAGGRGRGHVGQLDRLRDAAGCQRCPATFLVAKTDTGITIQTAFDPPHPVFGTESPVLPFTRVPM